MLKKFSEYVSESMGDLKAASDEADVLELRGRYPFRYEVMSEIELIPSDVENIIAAKYSIHSPRVAAEMNIEPNVIVKPLQ